MEPNLGFIGLGAMGAPMAHRLQAAGYRLVACDTNASALAGLAGSGAAIAATPADVASQADITFVSLPTPEVVRAVALGDDGIRNGKSTKIYVDMSTTGATTAQTVARQLLTCGIASVDAPVSGGVRGARDGTLTIMVSTDPASYQRVLPLLEVLGKKILYVGAAAGLAQTAKVINNLLAATAMVASCEAVVMGTKAGLDPQTLIDVINSGSGRNGATAEKFPRSILPRTFNHGFKTQLMYKDVKLCLEQAEQLGIPMWVGNAVKQMCGFAAAQGRPEEDFTEIIKHFEHWAGVEVRGTLPRQPTDAE